MVDINTAVATPPQTTRTALEHAKQGVQKNEQAFTKAANDIIESFSRAANEVSAATEQSTERPAATEVPPTDDRTASSASGADITRAVVDAKVAETAYKANLETIKAVGEMEKEIVDVLA